MAHQSQVWERSTRRGKREILRTILLSSSVIGIGLCSYTLPARAQSSQTPAGSTRAQSFAKMDISTITARAQSGDSGAQHELGDRYAFGTGVPRDFTQAIVWLRKAAQQGDVNAQSSLGTLLSAGMPGAPTDYVEAERWLRKAADQDDSAAQANLGGLYRNGTGVQKDYQIALSWFRRSANQGDPGGQFFLGFAFENGEGVPQDYTKAADWYQKSADKGFAASQFRLARLYYAGNGVPKSHTQAVQWLQRSASQGYPPAKQAMDYENRNSSGPSSPSSQSSSTSLNSAPPSSSSTQEGPSYEETINWLRDKFNSDAGYAFSETDTYLTANNKVDHDRVEIGYKVLSSGNCQMTYTAVVIKAASLSIAPDSHMDINFSTLPLNSMRTRALDLAKTEGAGYSAHNTILTAIRPDSDSYWILTVAINGKEVGEPPTYPVFASQEMAQRVVKALNHAIELCGGKRPPAEPF
jgi:TPR repeat protein